MMGWKSKFTLLLVVYFAGFATAIYMLAPVEPQNHDVQSNVIGRVRQFDISSLKSERFSESFACHMKNCITKARGVAVYLKDKLSVYEADKLTDS